MDTSAKLGAKLLQGWTMLNEYCPICKNVPLMRSRDGQEKVCVICSSKVPEKQEIQMTKPVDSNDSEHVQLLQSALIKIFESLHEIDGDEMQNVALDSLSAFQALSGGQFPLALKNNLEAILIKHEGRIASNFIISNAKLLVSVMKIRVFLNKIQ